MECNDIVCTKHKDKHTLIKLGPNLVNNTLNSTALSSAFSSNFPRIQSLANAIKNAPLKSVTSRPRFNTSNGRESKYRRAEIASYFPMG